MTCTSTAGISFLKKKPLYESMDIDTLNSMTIKSNICCDYHVDILDAMPNSIVEASSDLDIHDALELLKAKCD
jgi:hypothetical protein